MRNGIPIEFPSQRRKATRRVEGKLERYDFYKGKMVEMQYGNASVIMPAKAEWLREYIAEGWKVVRKWVAE